MAKSKDLKHQEAQLRQAEYDKLSVYDKMLRQELAGHDGKQLRKLHVQEEAMVAARSKALRAQAKVKP